MITFGNNFDPQFARIWGSFPVNAGSKEVTNISLFAHEFLVDVGGGRSLVDMWVLDLVEGFWKLRNEPNVLFFHYKDRVTKSSQVVERIASFMGVELTPEELKMIVDKTSFEEMRKEAHKYDICKVYDEFKQTGKFPKEVKGMVSELVNVGSARNGGKELPEWFVKNITTHVEKRFGKTIADWIQNGGELPDVDLPSNNKS
jgi:hypothetical protein